MKLLQITNSLHSGGAEKLVADTSILFKKKYNIEVEILVLDGTETNFYKRIAAEGSIPIHTLGRGYKNIYNPINSFRLTKYLKKFDIVHVHLFPALYWVGFAKILLNSKTKFIITEHNTTNRRRKHPIFKKLDLFIYKRYDKIITISDAVDVSLKEHLNFSSDKFLKIYNGINLTIIENAIPYSKENLGCAIDDILTIQVSSFTQQKDQKTLIDAIATLPEKFKLLLVGGGPLEKDLKTYVSERNLFSKVRFLGIRDDVPRLLKSVDNVVLSSNYEGLSLSSVEGLASGKPFLASDVPGLTEVVGDSGILFENKNYKSLAKYILKLNNEPDFKETVTKQCTSKAKKFDILLMIDNYNQLYEKLID